MSDVEIPVYVARAQVGSAIDLVVQLGRFSEDGSRRITRISEVVGLDKQNQYEIRDLFRIPFTGKDEAQRLQSTLKPTGEKPTFASEPFEQGLGDRIKHSREMWSDPVT